MERPKIQLIRGDDTKTLQGYIYELWSYCDHLESQLKESQSKLMIERRFRQEDATDHQGDQVMYSNTIKVLKSKLKERDVEIKRLKAKYQPGCHD